MASETRSLGGPAGIADVLDALFHVPSTPNIGRDAAVKACLRVLREQNVPVQRLLVTDQPVRRGSLFDASGVRVPFPPGREFERSFVGLADPEPAARWAHPAHWVFVPAEGAAHAVVAPTTLPQHPNTSAHFLPADST